MITPKISVVAVALVSCQPQPPAPVTSAPTPAPATRSPSADSPPPPASSPPAASSVPSAASSSSPIQWHGYYGGSEQFSVRALRSVAEWDGFWRQVQREKPRAIDPTREMGVVVFLGERNTGGYGVEIAGVQPEDRKLIVSYREQTPDPDMMVTQALTTPWAVAVVPRSELPIEPRKLAGPATRQRR